MAEPDSSGLQERLDAVVEELPVVTVKDEAAFAEEQREPIDQLVLMIFALLGLALVIAVLGIVNTLALSIIERTREVGLLRAIGLNRRQLRWMVTLESVVIAVLGALLGVVLGIGFGIAMMYAVRDEGLEVISVPWVQLAIFLRTVDRDRRARRRLPGPPGRAPRRTPRHRDRVSPAEVSRARQISAVDRSLTVRSETRSAVRP